MARRGDAGQGCGEILHHIGLGCLILLIPLLLLVGLVWFVIFGIDWTS